MPIRLFRSVGKICESELVPVPPRIVSRFLASSIFFVGLETQVYSVPFYPAMLPSHWSVPASNCAALPPSKEYIGMFWFTAAITVPSFGAVT